MALQDRNVAMVGLASIGDRPATPEQPPLADGIHLRYAFDRARGFPWYGFHLFRRAHGGAPMSFTGDVLGALEIGEQQQAELVTSLGTFRSDAPLMVTDDFAPTGRMELDLAGRGHLRFDLAAAKGARRVEVRLGFRPAPGDAAFTRSTVALSSLATGAGPNPLASAQATFLALHQNGRQLAQTIVRKLTVDGAAASGLDCGSGVEIGLRKPASHVEVALLLPGVADIGQRPLHELTLQPYLADGTAGEVVRVQPTQAARRAVVSLAGDGIARVSLRARNDGALLESVTLGDGRVSEIEVTAFAGTRVLERRRVAAYAWQQVAATFTHDGITAVDLGLGPAALLDVGIVPVEQDATQGWAPVPQFPAAMRLPLTHPDYPCTPGAPENLEQARTLARSRIAYGDPTAVVPAPVALPSPGTVQVTAGSPMVIGTGTSFGGELADAVIQVGADPTAYAVAMVVGPDKLVLSRPYAGATAAGATYAARRDPFAQLHDHLAQLVRDGPGAGAMADRREPAPVHAAGTVALAAGSAAVTGTGTSFVPAFVGLTLETPDGGYRIASVTSPTQLQLDRPYAGVSAPAATYAIAARPLAAAGSPRPPLRSPLDLVLLASAQPAVAQLLGLYWVDRTAVAGASYDYLVVPNGGEVASLDPAAVLARIQAEGFASLSGFMLSAQQLAPAEPVRTPADVSAHALPGATRPGLDGGIEDARASVGVRWALDLAADGELQPGSPVGYHVWRASLGNGADPGPAGAYALLTGNGPLFPLSRPSPAAQPPTGWPSSPLLYVDAPVPPGWHAYAVSAIDLFGRHGPRSEGVVVRAAAASPLPPPAAIEASALDPADPLLVKDAAYTAWWSAVTASAWYQSLTPQQRKDLVGLRVRFQWTAAQLEQAPQAREFRVRFAPGLRNTLLGRALAALPAGADETDVQTDIARADDPGSLAGASLRVSGDTFTIVGVLEGSPLRLRVRNVGPERSIRPAVPGGCAVTIPSGHALHEDPADPASWTTVLSVVPAAQGFTNVVGPDGQPARQYEVFLPAPAGPGTGLPLAPKLGEGIAYGEIGVGTADDRAEGPIGGPILVAKVRRDPPARPVTAAPLDPERAQASRRDAEGRSFHTFRFRAMDGVRVHVLRALDETLFATDWAARPRGPLDASDPALFPDAAVESRWDAARRVAVKTALDAVEAFAHDDAGTAQAMACYRALSHDAVRILAGLPGNERAFVQRTSEAIDPADPAFADRVGPDTAPSYVPQPGLCAFVDVLDGDAPHRLLYRAVHVDPAQNRSQPGLAAPPVIVPDALPAGAPTVVAAVAGDRNATLTWASSRERDVTEYRLYRASDADAARDVRTMFLAHVEPVGAVDPAARPAALSWTDPALAASTTYHYRVVAVDAAGNDSEPCRAVSARPHHGAPPAPPAWTTVAWTRSGNLVCALLRWTSSDERLKCWVEKRDAGTPTWRPITKEVAPVAPGSWEYLDDLVRVGTAYEYRIRAVDEAGNASAVYALYLLTPAIV